MLRALVDEQLLILSEDAPEVAAVFSWPRGWPEGFIEPMKRMRRQHAAVFGEMVEDGVRSGQISCAEPAVTLQCMHGVLNHASLWLQTKHDAQQRAALRAEVVETVLRMFR